MDKNERLSYLDTRSVNEATKRTIDIILKQYSDLKQSQLTPLTGTLYEERVKAIKNSLFLKYAGIEFESIFQKMYIDTKYTT